jgi:AcrR family transcriptional regulator
MPTPSTRERILAVASDLFTEQGYDGTSLREIADRMGFSKAALYYHFQSKDELLLALLEPFQELIREFVERAEAATGIEAWADVLEWMVERAFEMDFFTLIERNRSVIESMDIFGDRAEDHREMHRRIEAAVFSTSSDFGERVRMVAALAAVTGLDDWAPRLLTLAEPEVLRAELIATVRELLRLPARSDGGETLHHT